MILYAHKRTHHKEAVELKRKPEMIPTNFTLKKKKILKQIARIRGKSNAMPQKSGLSSQHLFQRENQRQGLVGSAPAC